jgi:hypothetical protein
MDAGGRRAAADLPDVGLGPVQSGRVLGSSIRLRIAKKEASGPAAHQDAGQRLRLPVAIAGRWAASRRRSRSSTVFSRREAPFVAVDEVVESQSSRDQESRWSSRRLPRNCQSAAHSAALAAHRTPRGSRAASHTVIADVDDSTGVASERWRQAIDVLQLLRALKQTAAHHHVASLA